MKKQKKIEKIIKILIKTYNKKTKPTVRRTSEQKNKNPYKTLIACLLSLRTRDENTEKVTKKLFKKAKTPKQISKLPIRKLEKLIYSSGYYKNKAKTIKHVSKIILKKHSGKVPNNKQELLSIKGIGPKTANVVLSFAFNKKVIPVDVNVHRVSNRLGLVKTKKPEQTEKQLERILPKKYWKEINTLFIQHGKNTCKPITPLCTKCLINKYCKKANVKKYK